mmetsp:Transcript_3420/g.6425  ORF Transcript_3420/g.6425 Transcript_3420/m.6425 type:complete len:286 (+) Transcript_3420:429-1286(+)
MFVLRGGHRRPQAKLLVDPGGDPAGPRKIARVPPRCPRLGGCNGSTTTTTTTTTSSLRIIDHGPLRPFQKRIPQRRMGEAHDDGHVLPLLQRHRPNRIPSHPLDDRHAPPALRLPPRIESPDQGNRPRDGTARRRGTRPGVRMRPPRVPRVDRPTRPPPARMRRGDIRRAVDARVVLSGGEGPRAGERVAGPGPPVVVVVVVIVVVVVVLRGGRIPGRGRRGGILREADGPARRRRFGGRAFGECDHRRDYSDGTVFEQSIRSDSGESTLVEHFRSRRYHGPGLR